MSCDEIALEILRIKKRHPEYRFGQIIANAVRHAGYMNCDPFHISNLELLKALMEIET